MHNNKTDNKLYGAILGDLCGQPYEFPIMVGPYTNVNIHNPISVITDDTLMTLATANAMLEDITFEEAYKDMGLRYPGDHYGSAFKQWINDPIGTIGKSYGNGCLMRISPLMYLNDTNEIKLKVIDSCICSHMNTISISSCLDLIDLYKSARYRLWMRLGREIVPFDRFKVKADDTFNFVKTCYNESLTLHEAIITAVECGGDTDTNASIVGELMNYTWNGITDSDIIYVESKLDKYLLDILQKFNYKYK